MLTLRLHPGRLDPTGNRRRHPPFVTVVCTNLLLTPTEMPVFAIPFALIPVLTKCLVLGRPTDSESTSVLWWLLRVILCAEPEQCLTNGMTFAEARVEPSMGSFAGWTRERLRFMLLWCPTSRIRLLLTWKTLLHELVGPPRLTMK